MNSRDAAYDEDEMLRRAIEESRETGSLGKRTRDDSEECVFVPNSPPSSNADQRT
jgi:Ubiquitin interaction motif